VHQQDINTGDEEDEEPIANGYRDNLTPDVTPPSSIKPPGYLKGKSDGYGWDKRRKQWTADLETSNVVGWLRGAYRGRKREPLQLSPDFPADPPRTDRIKP
jgi:hypothetical protein